MPGPASVVQGMTAQVGSALRCALWRNRRRWGPALLAFILLVGCGKDYDQEVDLQFNDTKKQYGIAVGGSDGGVIRRVDPGSRRVLLRISGAQVQKIRIYVYDENGNGPICSFEIDALPSNMVTEVNLECGSTEDVPPPPPPLLPDAGVDAQTPADLAPDITPDTGPSPCQEYCAAMEKNCPLVYPDGEGDCVATCTAYDWAPGPLGDNNTVACRLKRANDAPTSVEHLFTCYTAGPSGGRFCGLMCKNYCAAAARACPELEGDETTCGLHCEEPMLHPAYRTTTGDSMECRIFWLGEALKKSDHTICDRLRRGATAPLCQD
jgi:hypothetical protein